MAKADDLTQPPVNTKPRLVTIASGDNPTLLMSASTYPQVAGGPVTFTEQQSSVLQPFTWWNLFPVTTKRDIFLVFFLPSDGHLCLSAASTTTGSALQLATYDPGEQTQLWYLDEKATTPQLINSRGAPGMVFGFSHDIPLKQMPLEILNAPELNEMGDKFLISDVTIP